MSALYTLKDVAIKDGRNNPKTWIIIRDIVYDVTDYLPEHPGGGELISEYAGQDGTREFDDFGHSSAAMKMLKKYKIGELVEEDRKANRKNKKIKNTWESEIVKSESETKRKRSAWLFYCR